MDAVVLVRPNDRGNARFVKNTSRQTGKPMIDLTKMKVAGQEIRDGVRISIGADEARSILARCSFSGQRNTDVANLRAHTLDMQRGLFRPGSQIIFAQLPGNELILVNGYHRLQAVIAADAIIEFQVMIEPVLDYDGVRDLYCSIDTNMRKRTDGEIGRAAGLSEAIGVRHYLATAALGAVTAIVCGMRILKSAERPAEVVTAYGRKDAVMAWAPELRVYADILDRSSKTLKARLITQGMMAIALVTLRYQLEKATDFWIGVAENDGLRKGDPRKALISALLEGSHRGQVEAGLLYASVAWNAWMQDRQLQILRIYETTKCEPIGTPFGAPAKRKSHQRTVPTDGADA